MEHVHDHVELMTNSITMTIKLIFVCWKMDQTVRWLAIVWLYVISAHVCFFIKLSSLFDI